MLEFLVTADQMVVVFRLPELPLTFEQLVGFFRSEGLPRVQNTLQSPAGKGPENSMNMVRHHAPGKLAVALALKELECSCDHLGNLWLAELAGASPGIKVIFNIFGKKLVQAVA